MTDVQVWLVSNFQKQNKQEPLFRYQSTILVILCDYHNTAYYQHNNNLDISTFNVNLY